MYKFNKTIVRSVAVQFNPKSNIRPMTKTMTKTKTITGIEFKNTLKNFIPCKKITRNDYQLYKKGRTIVNNNFDIVQCYGGGIHFSNALNLNRHCCETNEKIAILRLIDDKSIHALGHTSVLEHDTYVTNSVIVEEVLGVRDFVRKMYRDHYSDILKIIDRFPSWIVYLKIQDQTPEVLTQAVQSDGLTLRFIKKQTHELCKYAVQNNGLALQYVDEQFLTNEIYTRAIESNPDALEFVDEENQTEEICYQAINLKPCALRHVKNQTVEMCMHAINKDPFAISACTYEFQTVQMCKHAIDLNPCVYDYIDRDFKTGEMYEYAQKKLRKT